VLARPFRLQKSADIQHCMRRGTRSRARYLQISAVKTGKPTTRFAFIVSNKISKRATARNRVKRLLREAVRPMLPTIAPGYDIIVWASAGIIGQTGDVLVHDLSQCLARIRTGVSV